MWSNKRIQNVIRHIAPAASFSRPLLQSRTMSSSADSKQRYFQLVQLLSVGGEAQKKLLEYWKAGFEAVNRDEAGKIVGTYQGFFPKVHNGDLSKQPESSQEIVAFESFTSVEDFKNGHEKHPTIVEFFRKLAEEKILERHPAPDVLKLEKTGLGFFSRGAAREAEVKGKGFKPYTLVVRVTFNSAADLEKGKEVFGVLAKYVEEKEPNTLTYEGFKVANRENEFLIFERYVQPEDLIDVHWKSEAFLHFQSTLKSLNIVKSREARTYEDLQLGTWGEW